MPCKECKDGNYKYGNTGECKYANKEACEKANPKKYNKMQPTPLGKKSYEEYEKELKEFNLSKVQRVELGLVDDVQKAVSLMKKNNSKLAKQIQVAKKAKQNFEKILENAKDTIEDVFDVGIKDLDDARDYRDKQESKIKEITKQAKELGVSVNDIKVIKEYEKEKDTLSKVGENLYNDLYSLQDIFAD